MEGSVHSMKKFVYFLCVVLLTSSVALSEKSDTEMMKLIYDGRYQDRDFDSDIGIVFTDYVFENEFGVFKISEMYYSGEIIRYVVVHMPKDPSIHFVCDPRDIAPKAEDIRSYDVYCVPSPGNGHSHGSDIRHYYRDEQLVCCYTFMNISKEDIVGSFPLEINILDLENQTRSKGLVETILEKAGTSLSYSININEWIAGVYIENVRISASPLDLACVLFYRDPTPLNPDSTLLSIDFSTGCDSAGSSSSDGYSYCWSSYPKEINPILDPLIIRYQDKALVMSLDGSYKEWVDFGSLKETGSRSKPFYLILTAEKP